MKRIILKNNGRFQADITQQQIVIIPSIGVVWTDTFLGWREIRIALTWLVFRCSIMIYKKDIWHGIE